MLIYDRMDSSSLFIGIRTVLHILLSFFNWKHESDHFFTNYHCDKLYWLTGSILVWRIKNTLRCKNNLTLLHVYIQRTNQYQVDELDLLYFVVVLSLLRWKPWINFCWLAMHPLWICLSKVSWRWCRSCSNLPSQSYKFWPRNLYVIIFNFSIFSMCYF